MPPQPPGRRQSAGGLGIPPDERPLLRALGEAGDSGGGTEGLAVDLVHLEPPHLLGEEVTELPAEQWQLTLGLARAGERRQPAVGPADAQLASALAVACGVSSAVLLPERDLDLGDAGAGGVDDGRLDAETGREPGAQKGGARVAGGRCHPCPGGGGREAVESRREERPPRGDPCPGEIGVARGEVVHPLAERRERVGGERGVGHAPVCEHGERVGGELVGRRPVPPRDDGGVRCQQWQDDRLGVEAEAPVHPHHDSFDRPEPAAHLHLGVEAVGGSSPAGGSR